MNGDEGFTTIELTRAEERARYPRRDLDSLQSKLVSPGADSRKRA
jgi:hypothetical protein